MNPLVSVTIWRLRALNLLARIIAAIPTALRCFNALAVNYTGTWRGFPAFFFSRYHDQCMIDLMQYPIVAPIIEIALYCGRRREVIGDHLPLATG